MIPPSLPDPALDPDIPASERTVFRALKEGLGSEETVIHGVSWQFMREHSHPSMGEVDFCIIDPARGMLVLEVKGGEKIRRDGDQRTWHSQDRSGGWHAIKDPAKQARNAVHSLKHYLRERLGPEGISCMVGFGVVFPGLPRLGRERNWGPDLPEELVIYSNELGDIGTRLTTIFEHWNAGHRKELDADLVAELEGALSPTFTVSVPLRHEIERVEAKVIELTEAQVRQFRSVQRNRVLDVVGSAGSGKTMLAMERARQCAEDGLRTLLTCHNQLLAAELKSMTAGTPNLTVEAFAPFCEGLAHEAGRKLPPESEKDKEYYQELLPLHFLDLLDSNEELRFDAIIVDEAQNLEGTSTESLLCALRDRDQSFFYRFLGEGQRIFGTDPAQGDPKSLSYELLENIRNTQAIHNLAICFSSGPTGSCPGPEGRAVEYVEAPDERKLREMVRKTLHRLHKSEQIPLEDVVILAGCNLSKSSFKDRTEVGPYTLRKDGVMPESAADSQVVDLFSIWRFQGLERKVVILVDLETPIKYDLQDVLYVAVTRAQAHLVIVGTAEVLTHMGRE